MIPDDLAAFGRDLARRLADQLRGDLVGAYFVGSVALGGFVAGESDVDIVAVSERSVPAADRHRIVGVVLDRAVACPTRGLEFTLYRREVAASPPPRAACGRNQWARVATGRAW